MSNIHYKFSASAKFRTITFNGLSISLQATLLQNFMAKLWKFLFLENNFKIANNYL